MARNDIIVLLHGIWYAMFSGMVFSDLSEDELKEDFNGLENFDKDEERYHAIISWLKDWRDAFEEIQWSIDQVLIYMAAHKPR